MIAIIIAFLSILLLILFVKFVYELIKNQKFKYFNSLRLLINFFIILFLCYGTFISLATYVRPPTELTLSETESLTNLSDWLISELLISGVYGLIIIGVLALIHYYFLKKINEEYFKPSIIKTTFINIFILILSIIITFYQVYNNLSIEIGYHFN